MNKQKVIIWTIGIDNLLEGKGHVGGLTVQMMFWAFTFRKENFEIYTFTEHKNRIFKDLNLLHFPQQKRLNHLFEILYSIYYIIKIRPGIILFRGASRSLFLLSYLSSLFKIKLIFMGASDVNFIIGKENIPGRNYNKWLYRKGLKKIKYIIVQNYQQAVSLLENYNKKSITIPNIWEGSSQNIDDKELIIWVGNFRRLKRPEWFIHLAKQFPNQVFVMAGFPFDKKLHQECLDLSKNIGNLSFLGPIPFQESEQLFSKAKILVCTSEYEGFPNTFLQAWSRNIPILSTVDPSHLISKKELGYLIANENELSNQLDRLINNKDLINKIEINISDYFNLSHNPKVHLKRLFNYIK